MIFNSLENYNQIAKIAIRIIGLMGYHKSHTFWGEDISGSIVISFRNIQTIGLRNMCGKQNEEAIGYDDS
jgi:hypothetical protein